MNHAFHLCLANFVYVHADFMLLLYRVERRNAF